MTAWSNPGGAERGAGGDEPDEPEPTPLTHEQALALFGARAMRPTRMSPVSVLLAQIVVSLVSAGLWLGWSAWRSPEGQADTLAGMSALLGGAACVVPATLFALVVARLQARGGRGSAASLVIGEAVKILLTLVIFALVAAGLPEVRWMPLGLTYVLALKVYWLALVLR